jgi:hypothetical protein
MPKIGVKYVFKKSEGKAEQTITNYVFIRTLYIERKTTTIRDYLFKNTLH